VLVAITGGLTLLRGTRSAAPAPAWASGQLVEPGLRWTSAGFTKPLRLVLELVLRPQREIVVQSEAGVLQEVSYSGHVPHLIDDHLYAPLERASLAAAAQARRLQSGSLGTYVVYLGGLVLLLLAAARLGWIG
jgi:hydrogenase-4 component B